MIGMHKLEHPIFYNAPVGIRFEIGGDESIYLDVDDNEHIMNLKYVSEALTRAKTIYENLPKKPDILRIDGYPNKKVTEEKLVLSICEEGKLPLPHEVVAAPFQWDEDDEVITQEQLYWDLNKFDFSPNTLLEEIVKADIGGYSGFASSVYFVDTTNDILYHLYDDRGLDVVAKSRESLYDIFTQFNNWILDYDREKINRIFSL